MQHDSIYLSSLSKAPQDLSNLFTAATDTQSASLSLSVPTQSSQASTSQATGGSFFDFSGSSDPGAQPTSAPASSLFEANKTSNSPDGQSKGSDTGSVINTEIIILIEDDDDDDNDSKHQGDWHPNHPHGSGHQGSSGDDDDGGDGDGTDQSKGGQDSDDRNGPTRNGGLSGSETDTDSDGTPYSDWTQNGNSSTSQGYSGQQSGSWESHSGSANSGSDVGASDSNSGSYLTSWSSIQAMDPTATGLGSDSTDGDDIFATSPDDGDSESGSDSDDDDDSDNEGLNMDATTSAVGASQSSSNYGKYHISEVYVLSSGQVKTLDPQELYESSTSPASQALPTDTSSASASSPFANGFPFSADSPFGTSSGQDPGPLSQASETSSAPVQTVSPISGVFASGGPNIPFYASPSGESQSQPAATTSTSSAQTDAVSGLFG